MDGLAGYSAVVDLSILANPRLPSSLFTWVYNGTNGSVLAVLLLHTAMNWSIWVAMPTMQLDLPTTGWIIAFLAVAVILLAFRGGKP